jgi:glycosyltransferase involved in cell wall biosynthesis
VERFTGRKPGKDLPAIYLEHTAPEGEVNNMRHPAAGRDGLTFVHVTHFNNLFWDCGVSRTVVIEHGICDPGHIYSGKLARAVAVVNDPVSRQRITGTDLLQSFRTRRGVPIDLFGMRSEPLGGRDVVQSNLHHEMAARRVYFHPNRWTSLGLSLVEAMYLGMPVVALDTTEANEAIPPGAGVCSNRPDVLERALRELLADPQAAAEAGATARKQAETRFSLSRFIDGWDRLLTEVAR